MDGFTERLLATQVEPHKGDQMFPRTTVTWVTDARNCYELGIVRRLSVSRSAKPSGRRLHGMARNRERIGVLGGTFDPPHIGHLLAAVNVRSALNLDRVLLVVANEPWQKVGTREISPAVDRLAMVVAAVVDLPGIEASDLEIRRGGPSFSVETLEALRSGLPDAELFLIVGADAAGALHTWVRSRELPALATLVLVDRPGVQADDPPEGWSLERVEIPRVEVSSTDLRSRVVEGRPLDFLIPPSVATCIAQRRLYGLADS